MSVTMVRDVIVRHDLRPGDLGRVTALHGVLYAEEYGFDRRFEAYVAETVGEFGRTFRTGRDRLWREGNAAQVRWLLVAPEGRRRGLGRRLVEEAPAFCRGAGYESVHLWTVNLLTTAARMYVEAGFRKTEALPPADWGAEVMEERYTAVCATVGPGGRLPA